MIITCPKCKKQHRVDESRIPAGGVMAKCNGCSHRFKIGPPSEKQIKCPNCGHTQPKGLECKSCGVIFAKFKSKVLPRKKPPTNEGLGRSGKEGVMSDNRLLKPCRACGEIMSDIARVCQNCGHDNLAHKTAEAIVTIFKWILIFSCVVGVLAGFSVWLMG